MLLKKSFVNNFYFDLSCPLKHRSFFLGLGFFSLNSLCTWPLTFQLNITLHYTQYIPYLFIALTFRLLEDNKVKTRGLNTLT